MLVGNATSFQSACVQSNILPKRMRTGKATEHAQRQSESQMPCQTDKSASPAVKRAKELLDELMLT